MKLLIFFIIGFFVGSLLTYIVIDKNFREITEPMSVFSHNLGLCEPLGEIAQHDTTIPNTRAYFNCIRKVYNFSEIN